MVAAMAASWVMTRMVAPPACRSRGGAEHLGARVAVEVAGGLVGEDDRRFADHGPGDGDPLALAARQGRGPVPEPVPETDLLEGGGRPTAPLEPGNAPVEQPVATLSRALRPSSRWNCWNTNPIARARSADRPCRPWSRCRHRRSAGALAGAVQGTDDVEQGRLPGARRADHGDELAAANVEVDAVERPDRWGAGILLHDPVEREHRASCRDDALHARGAGPGHEGTSTWSPAARSPLVGVTATQPSAKAPISTPTSVPSGRSTA